NPAHGRQQSCLLHGRTAIGVPPVQPHGDHGKIGQVDERTWAVGPQQLTRSHLSDRNTAHAAPPRPAPFLTLTLHEGGSGNFMSSITNWTPGSTSRIDIGTVSSSHARTPGFLRRPTTSPWRRSVSYPSRRPPLVASLTQRSNRSATMVAVWASIAFLPVTSQARSAIAFRTAPTSGFPVLSNRSAPRFGFRSSLSNLSRLTMVPVSPRSIARGANGVTDCAST